MKMQGSGLRPGAGKGRLSSITLVGELRYHYTGLKVKVREEVVVYELHSPVLLVFDLASTAS